MSGLDADRVAAMVEDTVKSADLAHQVLILSGAPGTGKTSVAHELAGREPRSVHLESDRFFHFIESSYVMPWTPEAHEQNEVVMAAVADAAVRYADAGYFTIVEGIIAPGWFFEPIRDRLVDAGHPVAYAVLRAPVDVCLQRMSARDPRSARVTEIVEKYAENFSDLGELERHVIEIDEESPEGVAERVAELLDSGAIDL
jgi:predicted kinase